MIEKEVYIFKTIQVYLKNPIKFTYTSQMDFSTGRLIGPESKKPLSYQEKVKRLFLSIKILQKVVNRKRMSVYLLLKLPREF